MIIAMVTIAQFDRNVHKIGGYKGGQDAALENMSDEDLDKMIAGLGE